MLQDIENKNERKYSETIAISKTTKKMVDRCKKSWAEEI